METLHNGFCLHICHGGFPLSTDSMALAGFVRVSRNAKILDLGSGCGTLGMLLCAEDPNCTVTGIEIDPLAHETALLNAKTNALTGRLTSICADLAEIDTMVAPGSFSICVSNPPYFTGGISHSTIPGARQEGTCTMESLFRSAGKALKYGGDFYLVHRPERLAELFACAANNALEPKRLQLLRHRQDGPVALVLVQCRKGGKPGLVWEEESLFDASGAPTEYYRRLYHI